MSPGTAVLAVLLAVIALGVVALQRGRAGVKELALVASLGAMAAAGRVLFAPIPSVKPVTLVCLATGAALGPRAGLAVGPVAALLSNSFLGQGPWTPPQMALWALVGLSGALLRPVARHGVGLAALGALWGFLFGWGMDLWELAAFGPEVSPAAFALSAGRSVAFDTAHAAGNVVFALAAGPALVRLLDRYRRRIRIVYADEGPEASSPEPVSGAAPA